MAAHGAAAAAAAVAPGVEQVVELFQNQRYRKFKGWSSRYLLNSDPGRYSDHTGAGERDRLDSRPPPGCVWADGDTGWELDTGYTRCDAEGWTYASSFRDFTSSNPGLPAAAEHGTRVRRRRYIRRGVTVGEDDVGDGVDDEDSSSASSSRPSSRRLTGKGARGSVGSRGSRRLTGRGSVGFALAPLDEVESMRVEVVIHGESFVVSAGPNDTVRWLQQEASALFSKEHNFHTHVVQVMEIYPRDIFQVEATGTGLSGGGGEGEGGGDAALPPLDPESLVKKVISAKDRTIFHPAPMEDGVAGVPDAKVWARVQATVTVPPGPLGVVLDGEVGDRPVVLEIPGQGGPAGGGMLTPDSRETVLTPEAFSVSPGAASAASPTKANAKPKVSKKDRAKRLLLSLATKHHFQNAAAGGGGGGAGEIADATAERSSERSSERRAPRGGGGGAPGQGAGAGGGGGAFFFFCRGVASYAS